MGRTTVENFFRRSVADRASIPVLLLMVVERIDERQTSRAFAAFVAEVEPRLRQALVATYGPVDGREATVDALSWAWEHWDRLLTIDNRPGYLYRVGQSAVRRFASTAVDPDFAKVGTVDAAEFEPGLLPALARLSVQQRTVVLLVHGHSWSQAEVARTLEINPSTVREHLARALDRLRNELETRDDD